MRESVSQVCGRMPIRIRGMQNWGRGVFDAVRQRVNMKYEQRYGESIKSDFAMNVYEANESLERSVLDWFRDNEGKGMILSGPTGVGKTELMDVLTLVVERMTDLKCYKAQVEDFYRNYDFFSKRNPTRIFYIDDIGREATATRKDFGNASLPLEELLDRGERDGIMLFFTTNLTPDTFKQMYGQRALSRLRANCRWINLNGKDHRR